MTKICTILINHMCSGVACSMSLQDSLLDSKFQTELGGKASVFAVADTAISKELKMIIPSAK